jgi:hypothetical protein
MRAAISEVADQRIERALRLRASAEAGGGWIEGRWDLSENGTSIASGTLRLAGEVPEHLPPCCDWALFAALPAAVALGGALIVEGTVTRRALADAAEVSRAWASWLPGEAHALSLSAAAVAEAEPWAQGQAVVLAAGADGAVPDGLPEGLAVSTLLVLGTAAAALRARAGGAGWHVVTLATPGVPDQAFFPSAVLRATGLHLLAGAGRMGLLVIEDRHAPRLGGPASQAQAAAFLSGGAMEVATPPAWRITAPMCGRCAAAMAGSSTKSSSTPPAAASESPMR